MSVRRWDPWSDVISLREAMDTLLHESFGQPQRGGTIGVFGLPLDLRETDNAYVIRAEFSARNFDHPSASRRPSANGSGVRSRQ